MPCILLRGVLEHGIKLGPLTVSICRCITGKQATITTESQTNVVAVNPNEIDESAAVPQLRRRSSSLDLGAEEEAPAPMQIVVSHGMRTI